MKGDILTKGMDADIKPYANLVFELAVTGVIAVGIAAAVSGSAPVATVGFAVFIGKHFLEAGIDAYASVIVDHVSDDSLKGLTINETIS